MAPDKNIERIKEAEETTKILNQAFYILSDPERRKQYDRVLRYTRGKDFGKILNAKEFWQKVAKAFPVLKQILENLKDLYGLFVNSVKGKYDLHPAISRYHRRWFAVFRHTAGFNTGLPSDCWSAVMIMPYCQPSSTLFREN